MIRSQHWFALAVALLCFTGSLAWRRRRRRCSTTPCQWHWSACSKTCGGGTQYPIKTVNQGSCGSCNMPSGTRACNTQCCRLDCSWNSWGNWGTCTQTCGGGIQLRTRAAYGPSCGGTPCQGVSEEQRDCNPQCCPVDCRWTSWEPIGSCSATCGGGLQLRNRTHEILPTCGGADCVGTNTESAECNTQCCAEDCEWETWGSWSICSKTCGGGSQTRVRNIDSPPVCGGRSCDGPASEHQGCNSQCCVIDCLWDDWSSWSDCSKTCDTGEQARERSVATFSQCGGTECEGEVCITRPCNDFCCPSQCEYGPWTQWSSCDKTCGTGSQMRHRQVTIDGSCVAQRCQDPVYEDRECSTNCCPVDCVLSEWTTWSGCSATCGSKGVQIRNRNVEQEMECGGVPCAPLDEEKPCNRICFHEESMMTSSGCVCADGWRGECCQIDINECDSVECTTHSTCINSEGSYECACNHNYTKEGDVCVHFDKCATGRHDCDEEAECVMKNRDEFVCTCYPGFQGDGFECIDANECIVEGEEQSGHSGEYEETSGEINDILDHGHPICDPNADCLNTYGSFQCECNAGYTGSGFNCTDVNECTSHMTTCSVNANCTNTLGSYKCWCKEGYYGDGITCIEILECNSNPCENAGLCLEEVGGFTCQCSAGYSGLSCTIDNLECEDGTATCDGENGKCFNTDGSYLCECKGGFTGDGRTCTDIDECALGTHDCHGLFPICRNVPGHYVCECEPGTERGEEQKS